MRGPKDVLLYFAFLRLGSQQGTARQATITTGTLIPVGHWSLNLARLAALGPRKAQLGHWTPEGPGARVG